MDLDSTVDPRMVQGALEIAAMCVGLVGLIGAAATTGMPMWKVTAFIGENIIVMETRWEGLWMNCYRQASFRMQCKVYDSLLFLPPELQAARGLMCCSLALSGLGLLLALAGMQCMSCFQGNRWAKTLFLMVAGGMQLLACICVFIPVSWTGHVIIRDFYNPLLIDAQRRELGEALYIGWVTGAFLFASAVMFLCRRLPSDKGSFDIYHPAKLLGYKPSASDGPLMRYHPVSGVSSLRSSAFVPSVQNNSCVGQLLTPLPNLKPQVISDDANLINHPVVYNLGVPQHGSMLYHSSVDHRSSMKSSNHVGSQYTPGTSLYFSQTTTMPYSSAYTGNPSPSYQSAFRPVPQTPIFIGYTASRVETPSHGGSGGGVYI